MGKTLGEITRSNGFDSLGDMVSQRLNECNEIEKKAFNIDDIVFLPLGYKKSGYEYEERLPTDTPFRITERSSFTLGSYFVRFEGLGETWFPGWVFESYTPVGVKDCESQCDRKVLMTTNGPIIVCNGCSRIVMDNRK